jgi:putative ABC transport system permease protein
MSEAVAIAPRRGFLRRPAFVDKLSKFATARADDFRLSFAALSGHKLRSGLTMLGIIIGVFTVVSMMALLNGLSKTINKQLGALGADAFQIQRFPAVQFSEFSPEIQARKKITLGMFHQLKDALPQAKVVGAEMWEYGKTSYAGPNTDMGTQVAGGTTEFFTINNLPIDSGRGYSEAEAEDGARVAVIGAAVVDALFPNSNPLGQKIKLGRIEMEVIGTIERQGGLPLGDNPDNTVAIPIALFMELYGPSRSIVLGVSAWDHDGMKKLQDQSVAAFRRIRGLDNAKENDFEIVSNDSLHEMFDNLSMMVKLASGVMCFLSLIVGGIGVMNIMLVAVTERTREIGLRKALGARRLRVLMQFIIEAILLAGIGGMIGVLMGYGAAWIGQFLQFPAEVPFWAVIMGLSVSCGVGLVAGIYPAWRASRLDPAVALRDE